MSRNRLKPKEGDLVYVEWVDTKGGHGSWREVERIQDLTIGKMTSLGKVFGTPKDGLIIASHFDEEGDNVQGDFIIPWCSIKKIRRMKV